MAKTPKERTDYLTLYVCLNSGELNYLYQLALKENQPFVTYVLSWRHQMPRVKRTFSEYSNSEIIKEYYKQVHAVEEQYENYLFGPKNQVK